MKFDLTPRLGSPVTGATDIEPEEPTQEPVITVNPEVSGQISINISVHAQDAMLISNITCQTASGRSILKPKL